jgi:uncharacterized Zn finger protein (UPF0148 family)
VRVDERRLTGHECPSCGAPVVNAQGLYTCFDCDWAFLSIPTSRERSFDHPVFNR